MPNADNTLDILVPHYKDTKGLEVSLRSVAEQTWLGQRRVVVVDDGSGADVVAVVNELAERQPFEVEVIALEKNRGRPFARNALLDAVDAPYVAWLDAGEVWYPEKLSIQFEHLRRLELNGVDVDRIWVTCHYDWAEGEDARRVLQRTNADQLADLLIGDRLRAYLWTLLGRASSFEVAGRFDERLPRLQDLDYFLRFVEAGGVIDAPPTRAPLCRYDKSDVGRSHHDVYGSSRLIMEKHARSYAKYGRGFVARAQWKYLNVSARYALNNRSYVPAARYLMRAALANPRYTAFKLRRRLISR